MIPAADDVKDTVPPTLPVVDKPCAGGPEMLAGVVVVAAAAVAEAAEGGSESVPVPALDGGVAGTGGKEV